MKIVNIYEAKTNFSKLVEMVLNGEEVVVAKAGKPVIDMKIHNPHKRELAWGTLAGRLEYKDEDFVGIDPEIQEMFYGKDWDK